MHTIQIKISTYHIRKVLLPYTVVTRQMKYFFKQDDPIFLNSFVADPLPVFVTKIVTEINGIDMIFTPFKYQDSSPRNFRRNLKR